MLAVVPARGSSKEVRRKNLTIVQGKPLLCHIADTLTDLQHQVVVSTEDTEIASVARVHGYEVHNRPPLLAEDDVTVNQVASQVCADLAYSGPLIVAQPTCPFIRPETINQLERRLESTTSATLVTPNQHLLRDENARLTVPVNRQWATGITQEVGVRAYTSPDFLGEDPVGTVQVEGREAYDIDTIWELRAAQTQPRSITIEVAGNQRIGTGHVYRGLALANELQHHSIVFHPVDAEPWVEQRIRDAGWPVRELDWPPSDLTIIDRLDTTRIEVGRLRANGSKVITIEDQGSGAQDADLVVNALYPHQGWSNEVSGPWWADLRPEFLGLPDYQVTDQKRILCMFGGTDPSNLGERIAKLLDVTWVRPGDDVSVAWEMMNHDLLVTSAGRTVYEAAAVGIPTVVIAQNAREATHAHLGEGNLYLGIGSVVTDDQILYSVNGLLDDHQLRSDLSQLSRRSVDGYGLQRIAWRAEGLLRGMK